MNRHSISRPIQKMKNAYNNRMQSDFGKRYALASAADARRYAALTSETISQKISMGGSKLYNL